jgi:hypothetical protein
MTSKPRFAACFITLALLSGISARLLADPARHIIILLACEYLLVLPTTLYALGAMGAARPATIPSPPLGILLAAFLAAVLPFSWIDSQSLLIPDESAYTFQARTYALGQFSATAPPGAPSRVEDTPMPLYFEHHILDGGRWFSKYPPGWPLLLAPALRLGVGWIANPVLSLALLVIVALITGRLFDKATASLAVLLAVLSPFFLANCVGRMSHPACGLFLAAACFFCFRGLRTRRSIDFALMFLLIVLALQVRPLTGVVVGGTLGLGALWYLRSDRAFPRVLMLGALFGVLGLASLLAYNKLYTGNPLLSPYAFFNRNPLTRTGNMSDIDLNPVHMLSHLTHATRWAVQDTVYYAFPFIFLLAVYGVWQEKEHAREVRILAFLFPVLVLAHLIQPSVSAEFVGERYYFEAYFAVLILGARGLALLASNRAIPKVAVSAVLIMFAAFALGQDVFAARDFLARTAPYRAVRSATKQLASGRYTVFLHDAGPFVAKHFNLNRPDWQNGNLFYLVDPGPASRSSWPCLVGRPAWVVLTYDATRHEVAKEFGNNSPCP